MGFVGLCLLVSAADTALAATAARGWYMSLNRPPATSPAWVFGPVWSVLYALMGVAGWLVWRRAGPGRALSLWGWQLAANALWASALFGLHNPLLALAVIVALTGLLIATMRSFSRIHRGATYVLVPYLLWTGYALYLNAGFCWLNPA